MPWKKSTVFFAHLGLSLILFSLITGIMLWRWYPGDLFSAAGGWQGLKIIAGVDLVLGPLLTLLFYRPNKPKVWLDMSFIASLQIAALVWGIYAVYQKHPATLVIAQNKLYAVSHEEFVAANALLRNEGVALEQPLKNNQFALYAKPIERENFGKYLASVFNGWPELPLRSDRYQPFDSARSEIEKLALSLEPEANAQGEHIALPYKSLYSQGTALLSKQTGALERLIPVVKPTEDTQVPD